MDTCDVAWVDQLAPLILASVAVVGALGSAVWVNVAVHFWKLSLFSDRKVLEFLVSCLIFITKLKLLSVIYIPHFNSRKF